MASSLRKRLGRKNTLEGDENKTSSASSSGCAGANDHAKGSPQDWQPIAPDDLSTTPPPNRKLRSSKDFSRDKTPPQSLLEKYKGRSARQAVPTISTAAPKKTSSTASSPPKAKGRSASSDSGVQSGPISPTRSTSAAETAKAKKATAPPDTRTVNGVEFDMLNQPKTHADTARHGSAQSETQHRRTRSQARREDLLKDDLRELRLDTGLEPPQPLSIRKVDRAPSPRVEEDAPNKEPKRDGSWESARKLEKQQTTSPPTTSPPKRHHTRATSIVNQAVTNLISFPPPPPPAPAPAPPQLKPTSTKSTPSSSPSSTPSILTPPALKKSILKNTHSPDSASLSLTLNIPVVFPSSPVGYIFCSENSSTSRPVEPWAWCKRWTCCTCSGGDELGVGMDGYGREDKRPPAATMAEQKICSRLSCGHVRCPGCWMAREERFAVGGPFMR